MEKLKSNNQQIQRALTNCRTLFATEYTIKKHTSGIYRKLETANRTELFEKVKQYSNV